MSPKSPPSFFDILHQIGFSKSRTGPPFTILRTLRFLSLRYNADFRRSPLVPMKTRILNYEINSHFCRKQLAEHNYNQHVPKLFRSNENNTNKKFLLWKMISVGKLPKIGFFAISM